MPQNMAVLHHGALNMLRQEPSKGRLKMKRFRTARNYTAHYRFTLTFRDRWRSRFENSQPQQIETCTTIPATLDQLQAIDVAFDRPGAVR